MGALCAVGAAAFGCGGDDGGDSDAGPRADGAPADAAAPGTTWPAPVDGVVTLSLADWPRLAEEDGWLRKIPQGLGHYLLVVHVGEELTSAAYVALDGTCTHDRCGVNYDVASDLVRCPCHGSRFALDGSVVRGPANRPLDQYEVDLTDGVLRITVG